MPPRIAPQDFARIMALPRALREDVLEYLGSAPVAACDVEQIVRRLSEGAEAPLWHPAGQAA